MDRLPALVLEEALHPQWDTAQHDLQVHDDINNDRGFMVSIDAYADSGTQMVVLDRLREAEYRRARERLRGASALA